MKTKSIENYIAEKRIVFYDGECGVCNFFVQKILRYKKSEFYYISLQSNLAKEILYFYGFKINMNTLFYYENDRVFEKSSAILQIARHLKFPYQILFFMGKITPLFLRNIFYDALAKNRYKIVPKNCYLPDKEEKKYFIL